MSRCLGFTPVSMLSKAISGSRLRIIAYHDVPDPDTFAQQLEILRRWFQPVGSEEVLASICHGRKLPRGAIWLTFDDAYPAVFEAGLDLLEEYDFPATVLVCPSVVDTDQPYWWQVIEEAVATGVPIPLAAGSRNDLAVLGELKRMPDEERREVVAAVSSELGRRNGSRLARPQVTREALDRWLASGRDVGNHTWDHPCLDTCATQEQDRQIRWADTWLREELSIEPTAFAFPNGNITRVAHQTLDRLGYPLRLTFDHRLARAKSRNLSRLRLDADAPIERVRAVTSGAHSFAFAARQRLVAYRLNDG